MLHFIRLRHELIRLVHHLLSLLHDHVGVHHSLGPNLASGAHGANAHHLLLLWPRPHHLVLRWKVLLTSHHVTAMRTLHKNLTNQPLTCFMRQHGFLPDVEDLHSEG